jgi:hypothetical protein
LGVVTRNRAIILALLAAACTGPADPGWHDEHGYRWRNLDVAARGEPGFTLLDPSRTGITFVNAVSDSLLVDNRILAQGGGTCLGDADGDGLPDVFLARTQGPSVLYRNLGDWHFEDVSVGAGIATTGRHTTGCAFADVDGDADLDLLVVALGGPNVLFRNNGKGRFTEEDAGLKSSAGSTTLAVADVDGDGYLDLYVANYKAATTLDRLSPLERSFNRVTRQVGKQKFEVREPYRGDYRLVDRADLGGVSLEQRADPDFFYLNDGHGRFVREPIAGNRRFVDEQGKSLEHEPDDFGLAAIFADVNGDGAPDLYVANDFEDPDQLWLNDGRGRFRLAPWYAIRSTSNSTMSVAVGDVNRDGLPDLFQVDMLSRDTRRLKTQIPSHTQPATRPGQGENRVQMQRNTLQLNRGDGTFGEIARLAGVEASGWSWSSVFLDVDLDGWEDILIGTGHPWDVMDGDTQYRLRDQFHEINWRRMLFEFPPLSLPNVAFRNHGDLTFEDMSRKWKFDIGKDISHGMALSDLDGDGDLDVVINRFRKPAAVLRNNAPAPRVAVRLRGIAPNTSGIGSRIRVLAGAVPLQQREVIAGGLYLSSSESLLTFATGKTEEVTIEVDWRDGRRTVIRGAHPSRIYEIDQRSAEPAPKQSSSAGPTLFQDVSDQLGGHRHVEPVFDDYARQFLLPNAFSQLGPGVAWDDVDRDGDEDLVVGAGNTGRLAWFRNDRGRLRPAPGPVSKAHGDITTILGWPDGRGGRSILAGISNYEMPTTDQALVVPSVVGYSMLGGAVTPLVGGDTASVGPIAVADYTGDGNLDMFVGGRILPGGYPLSPSSRLYRNTSGGLVYDTVNTRLLAGVGMVSAAVFSDINGDGWQDLIVAIEWGTIRVFLNEKGRFVPTPAMTGLAGLYSRWNGIATGDLDGDGRLDIVATSWGRNSDFRATESQPLFLYFGFFGQRGSPGTLLAQQDPRLGAVAPLASYPRLGLGMPGLTGRIRTFAAYADATIDDVLGPSATGAVRLGVTTLDHMLFLNRGDRFEARPLPLDAQMAPAFYAGIADFDGDGKEDLFLTQNFFETEGATPRYDAGRSLMLTGNGSGNLKPLTGQASGVAVYGEQRGAGYADFDADGRLDLAISQNGAATRLFRNVGAAPGLRVRVSGGAGNPTGIGTQMRLQYGSRLGPVQEIQAGSGYWSQNSAVQILGGLTGRPTALWLRWPGGREQLVPLAVGQTDITVRMP